MQKKKEAPKKRTPAKKVAVKKAIAKQVARKAVAVKHEITLHVDTAPIRPTEKALSEPMRDGKKLTIPKTWLADNQLNFMLQRTPREQVYRRKGKGGQEFDYVTGSYITKALNYVFGWNWDFDVMEHGKEANHVWVLGRLTVHGIGPGQTIVKTQFGRSDVKQLKTGGNVDYGNDLKAASTDALKKCASMLGFASDVYGKADYKAESGQSPMPTQPARPHTNGAQEYDGAEPVIEQGARTPITTVAVCNFTRGCGRDLTKSEAEYSKRIYGKTLCKDHYPKR